MTDKENRPPVEDLISTPAKLDLTEQRILVVGKGRKKKQVAVPVFFLTKSSKFFQSACKPEWKEGDNTIALPEESFETVEAYIQWLYTGVLYVLAPEEAKRFFEQRKDAWNEERDRAHDSLLASYVLGTFLGDKAYCNAVIDEYIRYYVVTLICPGDDIVRQAYKHLLPTSTLCVLMRDLRLGLPNHDLFDPDESLPQEFLRDLAKEAHAAWMDGLPYVAPEDQDRCYYHEHGDGAPTCKGPKPWASFIMESRGDEGDGNNKGTN